MRMVMVTMRQCANEYGDGDDEYDNDDGLWMMDKEDVDW